MRNMVAYYKQDGVCTCLNFILAVKWFYHKTEEESAVGEK